MRGCKNEVMPESKLQTVQGFRDLGCQKPVKGCKNEVLPESKLQKPPEPQPCVGPHDCE